MHERGHMAELLFIGGPWHGETHDVEEAEVTVQPPASAFLLRKNEDPMPAPSRYVMRVISGQQTTRRIMAIDAFPPQQCMFALADVLVKRWLEEGETVGIDDEGSSE